MNIMLCNVKDKVVVVCSHVLVFFLDLGKVVCFCLPKFVAKLT